MARDLVTKYDQLAGGFAEHSYANLHFYMHRRFTIATTWGISLQPRDSVLELGCGDGYLAQLFVQHGLRYCGVDISSKMVTMAEQRLGESGLKARFMATDVDQMTFSEPFDAVVSYMRDFFTYISNPLVVLKRLRPYVRKKIVLDLDPRRDIPLSVAIGMLKDAGFRNIAWRPFFVPLEKKLPVCVLKTLIVCEGIPVLRGLPLRWKFQVLVKGEAREVYL